jgi:opacity protein-like surface antigen
MKRVMLVALLVLCVGTLVGVGSAQTKFSLGVNVGPNFANLKTDPDLSWDSRFGFIIGADAEFMFSDMWGLQAGVEYIMKGAEYTFLNETVTIKLSDISIPIYVKVKFPLDGSAFKPFLFAGPQIGFITSAEIEGGGTTQDVKDQFESMDFALDFGAGGQYALNPKTAIFASLGYSLGLVNIVKLDVGEEGSMKTTGFQILVGVRFQL